MTRRLLALLIAAGFALPASAQDLIIGLSHPKTGRYSGLSATEVAVDIKSPCSTSPKM